MAFRNQATIGILILAVCSPALGEDYAVKHLHLRKYRPGVLTVDSGGVRYSEAKRGKPAHSFNWTWEDLQQVTLSPARLEIRTYRDRKLLAGKDEVQTFAGEGLDRAYDEFRKHLPRRFVPELARVEVEPRGTYPAKRLESRAGHQGALLIGADRLVFRSASAAGSHTWIFEEVDNISSSDPLQVTVVSLGQEYRLQLKHPFPEHVYNELWRKFNVKETH